ncbi:MAG: hypothetical protein ABFS03_06395 [Chloroflexota bacterium]
MDYYSDINLASRDPEKMESLFKSIQDTDRVGTFQAALTVCYQQDPENLLLAAWYFRLKQPVADDFDGSKAAVNWKLAVPISIVTGICFWLITDESGPLFLDYLPFLILLWAPIAAIFNLIFLAGTSNKHYRRTSFVGLVLLLISSLVFLLAPGLIERNQEHYLTLSAIHLPILAWVAIGITVLGLKSPFKHRFAFLIKSIEAIITAGLYLIFGVALGVITFGMFAALNVDIPEPIMRLIAAGGFGLLPTLAVASIYDPRLHPGEQDFSQGLSKFIATMMRLLLPLTLIVLVIYTFVIPFNFMEPFKQRDVLIVYNLMLFAVMGLLMGATPISSAELSQEVQKWLRNGIIAVAILATLISIYAMSATVYRTVGGGITINRLTIIGWNSINIGILIRLIYKQFKGGFENWVDSLQQTFSFGTNYYVIWGLFTIIAIPLIFR